MMFSISIDRNTAIVGSTLFIHATDEQFPLNIKFTTVYIGSIVAIISYYSPLKLSITIPNGLSSGEHQLYVFRSDLSIKSNSVNVNILYENVSFVDDNTFISNSKFSQKPFNNVAFYSKDISYSNFTEIIDENSIIQNVLSIILTKKGERILNPDFGTNIEYLLFSIVESYDVLEKSILYEIKSQVSIYEPRATIVDERSFVNINENDNSIYIILYIKLPGGNIKELGVSISSVKKVNV